MSILIASSNTGKICEFQQMLSGLGDWTDLANHGDIAPPEETGNTFRANACLKATYYAKHFNTWALADDSGLAVDALGGAPGVHSARWAEINSQSTSDIPANDRATRDAQNNRLLLQQLEKIKEPGRGARFMCVLALADPTGRIFLTTMDTVEGRLLREPRGENGFGYDPLFLIESLDKTTAELTPTEKHGISHRGKALRRLRDLMEKVGELPEMNDDGHG